MQVNEEGLRCKQELYELGWLGKLDKFDEWGGLGQLDYVESFSELDKLSELDDCRWLNRLGRGSYWLEFEIIIERPE